jgi:hypothetical protein
MNKKTGKQFVLHILQTELARIMGRDTHVPGWSAEMNKERADQQCGAVHAIENCLKKAGVQFEARIEDLRK